MGKSFAEEFWDNYVKKESPVAKRTRSASKKTSNVAPKAVAAAKAPAKPRAPSKPRVSKNVFTAKPVSNHMKCSEHVAPCPPGCTEYIYKNTYKCREKAAPRGKAPSKVSPVVKVEEQEMIAIQPPMEPIRPPKVPKFAVPVQKAEELKVRPPKVPVFAKPIQPSKQSQKTIYPELPMFEPNVRLQTAPPPRIKSGPNYSLTGFNNNSSVFGNLFEVEQEVEEAVEKQLSTPEGMQQEENLEAAIKAANVDIVSNEQMEAVNTYNALKSILSDDDRENMQRQVARIISEVNTITKGSKKVNESSKGAILALLEKHELCKLIKKAETRLFKSGKHSGEHTLLVLRAIAKDLMIKGHSNASRGELCLEISRVLMKSDAEFTQYLSSKDRSRIGNVARRVPKSTK